MAGVRYCQHLLPRHRGAGVQAGCLGGVRTYHRPLWDRGAGCLDGVRTYLPALWGRDAGCFKRCQNLPHGHCGIGVQAVKAVLEPMRRSKNFRQGGGVQVSLTKKSSDKAVFLSHQLNLQKLNGPFHRNHHQGAQWLSG